MESIKGNPAIWLNDLSWAYRSARVLHVANRLKLFTAIAGVSVSLTEICSRLNTKEQMTEKILIALCAMDLLQKDGDNYRNSEISETYLVEGKHLYQGNIIAHSDHIRRYWESLDDQICTEPLGDLDETVQHRNFIMGMDNIAAMGRVEFFLESIDLQNRTNLLDIGGGPGSYSIAACKKYPLLMATVFDLPETIAIAKEVIARDGMADRVSTRPGSWDDDDYGSGFDVVLFSNVLHGPSSSAEIKLTKAYKAMQGGGMLVIQEFLLNDEKTAPQMPALFNVMVGAYSQSELLKVIANAGFKNAAVVSDNQQLGATWIAAIR